MKFFSLLKNSCHHQPKTLSFRVLVNNNNNNNDVAINKTIAVNVNSSSPESVFTETPASGSFSTASEDYSPCGAPTIRGLRSDRFFFEPDETSSSILDYSKLAAVASCGSLVLKDSVAVEVESRDPHADFRKSMEEMVMAHGVKDWEGLEELLTRYLKVNDKSNHAFIVNAFLDLFGSPNSSSTSCVKQGIIIRQDQPSSSSYSAKCGVK